MAIQLYPFRYRDLHTGKWIRARHLAEREVSTKRFAEREIAGRVYAVAGTELPTGASNRTGVALCASSSRFAFCSAR
jgi:hypothetical protein